MPEPLYALTQFDRDRFFRGMELIDRFLGNTANRPPTDQDQWHQGPETYLALTPAGGIPALTAAADGADVPGFADCRVYQVVGRGSTTAELVSTGSERTFQVHNASGSAVAADSWVLVTRDKFGTWWVVTAATAAASPGVWLVPLEQVSATAPPTGCDTGTGTTSGEAGETCFPDHFYCCVQEYDPACGDWTSVGCCYAAGADGQRLELNKRYFGVLAGEPPDVVSAATRPLGLACACSDVDPTTKLYLVDVGDTTRTFFVTAEVGPLCAGSPDQTNPTVYQGYTARWNHRTCAHDEIDPAALLVEIHGCDLQVGETYEGQFQRMVPESEWGGGASGRTCTPLFSTDDRHPSLDLVYDVRCEGGVLRVYKPLYDDCGRITGEYYSHSAGCCDCGGDEGDDPGTGFGDGEPDCCPERWTSGVPVHLYARVPTVGTVELTLVAALQWVGGFTLPCGLAVFLKWDGNGCGMQWSCSDSGPWVSLATPIGHTVDCGPPMEIGPFDDLDAAGDAASAGCAANACVTINGITLYE